MASNQRHVHVFGESLWHLAPSVPPPARIDAYGGDMSTVDLRAETRKKRGSLAGASEMRAQRC